MIWITCLVCPDAPEQWLELLRPMISESLHDENGMRLIPGLLIVRHVTFSAATPGTCLTYKQQGEFGFAFWTFSVKLLAPLGGIFIQTPNCSFIGTIFS